MEIPRLPRRLFYKFPNSPETEYGQDIPTPPPEVKCDEVPVQIPPSAPGWFYLFATNRNGQTLQQEVFFSYSVPGIQQLSRGNGYCYFYAWGTNERGQSFARGDVFSDWICGSAYLTPGWTTKPRRDLMIGSARISAPGLDLPCPTWRFTGGGCPDGSLDCGDCCLDCAATAAQLNAAAGSISAYSAWRKK